MRCASPFHFFLLRLLPLLVIGLAGARVYAQGDPPARVARLNQAQGAIAFAPAGDNEWTDASVNRPLMRGDRLWADKGSRGELQVGSSAVRLDGQTQLEILALDDRSAQLSVTQGSVYVRVRSLPEGENFEIDTPNLAYRAAYPGDYRIDVDAASGMTRVTIHSGTGAVYGEGGQVLPLGGGQQVTFRARDLAQVAAQESPPQDNFDRWAVERNRREDQSVAARYVPREVAGYQQLDAHGQWTQDATYGAVWFPQGTPAHWAPYRNGQWEWIAPWGWTWIDEAAWGFAPFHYGRWALIDSRWGWVPGRMGLKPVYAPALVAFVGGAGGGVNWSLPIGSGRPGVAWFPLAPGEPWYPGYAATPAYLANVNLGTQAPTTYANQRKTEALTSIAAEDFHRGKPVRASWLRVVANTLTDAQVVPPPPMPERSGVFEHRLAAARMAASQPRPVPAEPPKVAAAVNPPPPAVPAAAPAAAAPHAKATVPEVARRADAAKAAKAAKAEHARIEQARAEQARREQAARAAEHARREALAMREQARQERVAKRAEQQRREQQARAEQARREAVAQRDEQQRRELHAQQVEQSRRAAEHDAQALREQRARREELQARREAQEREQAQREQAQREQAQREASQREAWARRQQALEAQWRRDQQAWELQQQRDRARQRPDLRDDRRSRLRQRGVPILGAGPLS